MRMSMPWEAAVRAAAVVERIGMIAMVYVGETLLITPYDDMAFSRYKSNEGYLTSKKVVPSVAEYIAIHHISVDKIFIRSQDPVMLVRARAQLEQIPGIRVMSSASDNLEVITPAADKGNALAMLCRQIGTDLSHAARTSTVSPTEATSTTPPPSATARTTWKCCTPLRCRSRWAMPAKRSKRCVCGKQRPMRRTALPQPSTASLRRMPQSDFTQKQWYLIA